MEPLGYARWENFKTAIKGAIESCGTSGYDARNHFRGITKMVALGSGSERGIEDFILTRYACYLIAQNGDPRKDAIVVVPVTVFAAQAGRLRHICLR